MTVMPMETRARLRRLARRLAAGVFLDIWMPAAAAALLAAGLAALACRIFLPPAADRLAWLWLAPAIALLPAGVLTWRRAYAPSDVVAIADWLGGGRGTLMAVSETGDPAWSASPELERAATFPLPRLNPWRKLPPLAGAAVFLAVAIALPQRERRGVNTVVADEIAKRLEAAVAELKQQQLVTPEEEKKLEEEIERVRRGAEQRMDAASWEAADALREKLAADVANKQSALKWAEQSLARLAATVQSGGAGTPAAEASAAELAAALDTLAKAGMGVPEKLKALLKSGKRGDAASMRELMAATAKYLKEANGRMGELGKLGKEFGRFNPADFPLGDTGGPGEEPGQGAATRGRADAELTWGKETSKFDRFKSKPLPPGAARSPDDWAPVTEMMGAPDESAERGGAAAVRDYAAGAGQAAWRRGLAPRHQSAVKKYFAKGEGR